ncbi:DUF6321 domain-containing protein [Isosphaeraceae bacterium EP7]
MATEGEGSASKKPKARPKKTASKGPTKDPKGGLTAAGRAAFKKSEGANLRPGVTKPLADMTPEDMKRKGSFLRRHFVTLRGPLVDDKGEPTRLALQAHAWGEAVPKTPADAKKLAEKGADLLDRYHKAQDSEKSKAGTKTNAPKAKAKKADHSDAKPKAKPAASKKASSKSTDKTYTDPGLRERLKAQIMAGDKGGKPDQWSARKSQLLAAEYKKAGGGYTRGKAMKTESQEHLDHWTDQDWTTADGKPAERDGETARYLPEAAWDELTPAQKQATDSKKNAASKGGKTSVANTKAAKKAVRKATS